jgi:iron complex outermembrane receptor protein
LNDLPFDGNLGVFYRYQSSVSYDLAGDPLARQDGYGILDLSAGLRDKQGHLSCEVFVNNATNRHYYSSVTRDTLSPAVALIAFFPAYSRDSFRLFGLRVNAQF